MENLELKITPINHATILFEWEGKTILTDPYGGEALFSAVPNVDLILVTDIHQDHLDLNSLSVVVKDKTKLLVPKAVYEKLPENYRSKSIVISNGESTQWENFKIEAIPMYNVPETETSFHVKGRGNGYVLEGGGKRVYISGDTSSIPEMKDIKNIDLAFVCMNLPYTMNVEEAASAVLQFNPKTVTPYHYKGSNIEKFKEIVNSANPDIKVEIMDFYPQTK